MNWLGSGVMWGRPVLKLLTCAFHQSYRLGTTTCSALTLDRTAGPLLRVMAALGVPFVPAWEVALLKRRTVPNN